MLKKGEPWKCRKNESTQQIWKKTSNHLPHRTHSPGTPKTSSRTFQHEAKPIRKSCYLQGPRRFQRAPRHETENMEKEKNAA